MTQKDFEMAKYIPDAWVILRIKTSDGEKIDKVLAGWYGGFAGKDHWKLNSGITKIEVETGSVESPDVYHIHGYSGSVYVCHELEERLTGLTGSVFQNLVDDLKAYGATVEMIDIDEILEEYK
jgi:hypothetical protein